MDSRLPNHVPTLQSIVRDSNEQIATLKTAISEQAHRPRAIHRRVLEEREQKQHVAVADLALPSSAVHRGNLHRPVEVHGMVSIHEIHWGLPRDVPTLQRMVCESNEQIRKLTTAISDEAHCLCACHKRLLKDCEMKQHVANGAHPRSIRVDGPRWLIYIFQIFDMFRRCFASKVVDEFLDDVSKVLFFKVYFPEVLASQNFENDHISLCTQCLKAFRQDSESSRWYLSF